jgi:hypothetical protein
MRKRGKRQKKEVMLPTSKVSKSIQTAKELNKKHAQGIKLSQGLLESVEELRNGTRSEKVVLKEIEVLCRAQRIVLAECQGTAAKINPIPQLNAALMSIQHEKNRKEAAEQGSQRSLRESANVREARAILAENKENRPPAIRNKNYRNVKGKEAGGWVPPFTFPTPSNGSQYSPPEVVALLIDRCLLHRKHAGNAKWHLIENELVPVKTESAIARVVRNAKGDPLKAPEWWNDIGRPPICLPSQFVAAFDTALLSSGMTTSGILEVGALLVQMKEDNMRRQGIEPTNTTVSAPCKQKYDAIVKQSENVVVVPDTLDTTETRDIAGNSLIAAVLFAACVLVTTYRLCELEDADEWKFPKNATEGAKEGYEIMKKVHGDKPFLCIMPFQQINMDNTTQLVCNGTNDREKPSARVMHISNYKSNRRRAPKKSPKTLSVGGTQPQDQPQNDPINPQRVKILHISNAYGSYAEPTINFLGISEEELPSSKCPTGFASVEIHGLLEGKIIFVNFMRKNAVRSEEARYVALRNGPLHRFVDAIWHKHYGIQAGGTLKEKHMCVVSCDGDLGQVACVKDNEMIEKERQKKIASWKHNPAGTQREQSQDLQNVFPEMNHLEATTTIDEDMPDEMIPLLCLVKEVFTKCNRTFGLNFPDKKKQTNMHFLARFPENYMTATQKKHVMPGYLANGQVNYLSRMVPDLKVMIEDTLDRPIFMWEWKLVRARMVAVCELMLVQGWISDHTFISWGFPADLNLLGEEVYRPDSVAQEHLQRAKLMDHPYQVVK